MVNIENPAICPKTNEVCPARSICVRLRTMLDEELDDRQGVIKISSRNYAIAASGIAASYGLVPSCVPVTSSVLGSASSEQISKYEARIDEILIVNCVNDVCIVDSALSVEPELTSLIDKHINKENIDG